MKLFYEHLDGLRASNSGGLAWPAHLHNYTEIIYMRQGTAHGFADGVDCRLEKGDFFIAFPDKIHYYDDCRDCDVIVILIPGEMLSEYRDILLKKSPLSPVIKNARPEARQLAELLTEFSETHQTAIQRGISLTLLGLLFEKMEFVDSKNNTCTTVQAIIAYCEENFKNNITVESIAKALHISCSYVSHTFSEKLHMSFRDYLNSLRVSEAISLLEKGDLNMTQVALESGFDSIRTFNRAFRKIYGTSPLKYKKEYGLH